MPWKIVNLDYVAARPHLHLKDPNAPIHLRAFFADSRVEIGLGADDPEDCIVRATVTPDDVVVQATEFEPLHVQILDSILVSLDVEPAERHEALAWMHERLSAHGVDPRARTRVRGNVDAFPEETGWPYDLTDDALVESLADREGAPHTRLGALRREAVRRGLVEQTRDGRERGRPSPAREGGGPEVIQRRPRR